MKKLICLVFLLVSFPALAQEFPKLELGFSYGLGIPVEDDEFLEALGIADPYSHGWSVMAHVPLTSTVGMYVSGGGSYLRLNEIVLGAPLNISANGYGISGGPCYTKRSEVIDLRIFGGIGFSRVNSEVSHLYDSFKGSTTAFSFGGGIGMIWNINKNIGIMAPMVAYGISRTEGEFGHGLSVSFGPVFKIF